MNRRRFICSLGSVAGSALTGMRVNQPASAVAATRPLAAAAPLPLGGQRHMFIDDMLIAAMKGVTFQVRPPDIRETVLTPDNPRQVLSAYSSVIDDGKELKMYYSTLGPLTVRLATSKDGIHWEKPQLGIYNLAGSKKNNVLFDYTINGSAYYDEHDPDPARRYKYFTCYMSDGKKETKTTEGIVLYTSPDGIHFTKHETQLLPLDADSQAVFFHDHYLNKYVCYLRGWRFPRIRTVVRGETDDPMRPWPYTPATKPFHNGHELPLASTELPVVLQTDQSDPPETDLYAGQVFLYPWAYKVYLAFPTYYYHFKGDERRHLSPTGAPGNLGAGEVQLAVSRDGIHWKRYRRPAYVKAGWYRNSYCAWPWVLQGMVRRGHLIYQYVSLRSSGHGGKDLVESDREYPGFTLCEQQADRFVGAEFDYTGGTLTTEPFVFAGNRLALNLDTGAMGEGRVAILGVDGKAITGYELEQCDLLNGDYFDKVISWKGRKDVASLAGKAVRLHIKMRGTKLYAFQFVQHKTD